MEEPNPRKRPRPVVSCLRCREKKLKCDRTTPCENCVKAQHSQACTYSQKVTTPLAKEAVPNPSRKLATTVEEMQRRLNRVEEMLGISLEVTSDDTTVETSSPNLLGTVVVKGTRTVYHGQNDRTTLLNQFLDVKSFISTMSSDPKIAASAKQVKFLQNRSQAAKVASPGSENGPEFSLALLKLKEFLPPRAFCDRLVDVYCQNFERTMRVLHIPTFKKEYESIWQGSAPELCTTSSIIPQLTAVMTMAYHMDSPFQPDKTEQPHRTYLKSAANDLVQAWLDELGRKQRTELATLQVEILLLLSRSLKGMYPEKLWAATGALVRSAVVMGLNMNPELLIAMKPYHVEMRKRIWATVLEIDLQASMTCGMPLVVPELDLASIQPLNLNDADFDEDTTVLPDAPSLDTYTDNLYQVILAASLPARLKAQSLVQRSAPVIAQAAKIGREIEAAIASKPTLMALDSRSLALAGDAGALLHRVLLDLYLRRPLLCLYKPLLHTPYDSNATSHAAMHRYCLDCSQAILAYQHLYTISSLSAITSSPQAHQNFFYRCCKMDILWAALALCQHIKQLHARGETDTDEVRGLIGTVESTVGCLVSRIEQRGSDIKDIVFLALVLKSVQIPDCAPDREEQLRSVVQQTLGTCRGVLLQSVVGEQEGSSAHVAGYSNGEMAGRITVPAVERSIGPAEGMMPLDNLLEMAQQWSTDLPGLDIDFNTIQAEMGNSGDALNFGVAQDWNWEHLWQ